MPLLAHRDRGAVGPMLLAVLLCAAASPAQAQIEAEFADEYDSPESYPPPAVTPEEPAAVQPAPAAQPAPEAQPSAPQAPATSAPATTTAPAASEPSAAAEVSTTLSVQASPTTTATTASADGSATAAPPAGEAWPPETPEERSLRMHNSWLGPVGGIHVVDAASGLPGTVRLQLGVDLFSSSDFLIEGDENDYFGGTLSIGWTTGELIELFAAIASHANSNTEEDPELLQALGDTHFGIKAFQRIDWLALGGDLRFVFLNTVGGLGPVLGGTSMGIRANASGDFRRLAEPIPLIARMSLDYFLDNSAVLIEDVETDRYASLGNNAADLANEDRHLLRRVERFALGVNRVDAFGIALGVEAPLRVDRELFIHPMLEWTLSIPVNRQGYDCLLVPTDAGAGGGDGCLDQEGLAAAPSTLTFGARVLPPVRGLAFTLGVDVGISGTSTFVRELAPNRPWAVLLALALTADPRPPPPAPVQIQPIAAPPPIHIDGWVMEQGTETPIGGAVIAYPGTNLSAQLSDARGYFKSYSVEPGLVRLFVSHPDYEGRDCTVDVPDPSAQVVTSAATPLQGSAGIEATTAAGTAAPAAQPPANPHAIPLRCELKAKPRGKLQASVVNTQGEPVVGARVVLGGPTARELLTDAQGSANAEGLAPGSYEARVEADAYLVKLTRIAVTAGLVATPRIELQAKPEDAQVELTQSEVRIRQQVLFRTGSAEILEKSSALIDEIADVLLRNPQVRNIEVQGHTDSSGNADLNMALSQDRAEAVMRALIDRGVESTRLSAKGYGDTRPLAPNITAANRARNRRVQFVISQ